MSEQLYSVGIPLTTGYFTATIDADSATEALDLIKGMVENGTDVHGMFGMPGAPPHKPAPMILNPAHVVGYVIKS